MTISKLNRSRAASFFVGATLFWLIAFLLHKAGYIYIYTQDHQAKFRTFNEAVSKVQGDIEQFEEVLLGAQAAYEKARAEGRLPDIDSVRIVRLEKVLPEFYDNVAKPLMDRTNTFFYVRQNGDGYKLLLNSEICPAVALIRPSLVDSRRARSALFCRYFGVWNRAGAAL